MKSRTIIRLIVAVIIATILLSISGCEQNKSDAELFFDGTELSLNLSFNTISDGYLYYSQESTYDIITPAGKTVAQKCTRLVKVNLSTLDVSPVCIDPLCTHCPDDCPLCFDTGDTLLSISSIGKWIYFTVRKAETTDSGSSLVYMTYNIETGEYKNLFGIENGGTDFFDSTPCPYNGLLYVVMCSLKENAQSEDDKEYYLASYDITREKTEKLFAVDSNAQLNAITNKNFYFTGGFSESGESLKAYSVDHNGQNRVNNPAFDRSAVCFSGSRAFTSCDYEYDDNGIICGNTDHCSMFDFETSSWTEIPEGGGWSCAQHGDSIYYIAYDNMSEYASINKNDFAKHYPGLSSSELSSKYYNYKEGKVAGGHINIMKCDIDGKNPTVLYSYAASKMTVYAITDKYVCTYLKQYDYDAYVASKTISTVKESNLVLISLETGEIIDIPEFRFE